MKKQAIIVLILIVAAFAVPSLVGFWVYQEVQQRLKIDIQGDFRPVLLQPAFRIRNASFDYKDKVAMVSGDISIHYDLRSILQQKMIRIRIDGDDAAIELKGLWSKMQGVGAVKLDLFHAELGLGLEGIQEIYAVEAKAPGLQFQIHKSEMI